MGTSKLVLDQAHDEMARFIEATATQYDAYLGEDWKDHRAHFRTEWDDHYDRMDTGLQNCIWHIAEQNGRTRSSINLALIGPGFHPVRNEISLKTRDVILRKLKSIIVVDFSQRVVQSAMTELTSQIDGKAGIDPNKVLGMQFDVTDGYSTLYDRVISKEMNQVTTEEEFMSAIQSLSEIDMKHFEERLLEEMLVMATEDQQKRAPRFILDGGDNIGRKFKLTANEGQVELPIDIAAFQMVLAGTGAAAEAKIWSKMKDIHDSGEDRVAMPVGPERDQARITAYEKVHALISTFNTWVAQGAIETVIRDNPNATVYAWTDVSTIYEDQRIGRQNRLYVDKLQADLSAVGIRLTVMKSAQWKDEPTHEHQVYELIAVKSGNGGSHGESDQK